MTDKRIAEKYNGEYGFYKSYYLEWCEKRIERLEKALTYAMNPNGHGLPLEKWIANIVKRVKE